MNFKLLTFIAFLFFASCTTFKQAEIVNTTLDSMNSLHKAKDVEITIRPDGHVYTMPRLRVRLEFTMNDDGTQKIVLPSSWAGQGNLYSGITDLKSETENVAIHDTADPSIKVVRGSQKKK